MEIHDEITPNSGSLPEKGLGGNELITQKGVAIADTIPDMQQRTPSNVLLSENLNRLMATTQALKSNPKLSHRAGVGLGTVGRVRNAEVHATLDTLDKIAAAFGVKPWELLIGQKEQLSNTLLSPQLQLEMSTPAEPEPKPAIEVPSQTAPAQEPSNSTAQELAALLEMVTDRVDRIRAFNAATEAILRILTGREPQPSDAPAQSETARK